MKVNEAVADIPKHEWQKKRPAIVTFDIPDTARYEIFLLMRHTQQYPYNNILLNIAIKDTSNHVLTAINVNAPLTTKAGKWTGFNIDDLYDHRIRLHTAVPLRKNRYHFIISQRMKDDPLPFVLNAGIALEEASTTAD